MSNYLVIGDIHGDFSQLKKMNFDKYSDRKIIFLGDYINRGNFSKSVVDLLIEIKNQYNSLFLLGNHDYSLLKFIELNNFYNFAVLGGIETIQSYTGGIKENIYQEFIGKIPDTHLEFFISLIPFYEDDKYFFSHSGINTHNPDSRELLDLINNSDFEAIKNYSFHKTIVCGHFTQRSYLPFMSKNLICLDTGCGSINGPLTFLLLPERIIIKV